VNGGAQPLYYHGPRTNDDLEEEAIGAATLPKEYGADIVLSVNGEIYNHKKLRAQLEASSSTKPKFFTESDCEVLMHMYAHHGPSFLSLLDGMFGFAMVDEAKQTALVARDHLGIIPLYYGRDAAGSVWVSSEIKTLFDICVTFHEFPPGMCLRELSQIFRVVFALAFSLVGRSMCRSFHDSISEW
jgi:asparagine synthetase B (glutamine-hydrolysing)